MSNETVADDRVRTVVVPMTDLREGDVVRTSGLRVALVRRIGPGYRNDVVAFEGSIIGDIEHIKQQYVFRGIVTDREWTVQGAPWVRIVVEREPVVSDDSSVCEDDGEHGGPVFDFGARNVCKEHAKERGIY